METPRMYPLFDVTGVELEYMVVDRDTLEIRTIVDELLKEVTGAYTADYENGDIAWSNELVAHVVELKTNGPAPDLTPLSGRFHENVADINRRLAAENAMLLPTAAHPLMDPMTDTKIWPHEYNEIYALYNRIFDCRGHGWSNLQSTHINLPFAGDVEFAKLHAAIRLVLPIIPALCASSPFLDGKPTGYKDSRMEAYLHHQERMPSLMGKLIPEAVFDQAAYQDRIFSRINKDIEPFDKDGVMEQHFLNSRGAIARFDRGSIEIRVMDIQECPAADLAQVWVIVQLLKQLVSEKWVPLDVQKQWSEDDLLPWFEKAIESAEDAEITQQDYLRMFGIRDSRMTMRRLWGCLFDELVRSAPAQVQKILATILDRGTLATRMLRALDGKSGSESIQKVYRDLAVCLAENRLLQ